MSSGSSSGAPARKWGQCSKACLSRSKLVFMEHIGTHRISFNFKHWCVEITVDCPEHGRQIWIVEKELRSAHAAADHQYFINHCVVMWCGRYATYLCKEQSRLMKPSATLDSVYDIVMGWTENGYNWANDNCATFANQMSSALP